MKIRFSHIALLLAAVLFLAIYFLHLRGFVSVPNEVYARHVLRAVFVVSALALFCSKFKIQNLKLHDFYKENALIITTLSFLLIVSIFQSIIASWATGIFAIAALLHFIFNRKFYPLNKAYYFLFAYALLIFFGTTGTPQGFRFPEITYSYYVLPLSFCVFRLKQKTLLKIAHLFFQTMIIYMIISVLYWFFNFLYLDANIADWLLHKSVYAADMQGWTEQFEKTQCNIYNAYFFVTSWSGYFHPSFVSYVLLLALVAGFYLYNKKSVLPTVTKIELAVFVSLCLALELLMQSRVGVIGFVFVIAAAVLYYSKKRRRYFSIIIVIYLIAGGAILYFFNDKIDGFIDDGIRDVYRTLAFNYIKGHFWWGCGYREQYAALTQQYEMMKDTLPALTSFLPHSHNQFTGDMVQFGVWGLLSIVAMLGAFAVYAVRCRSYLLQMLLCITVLLMFIDEPLYNQAGVTRFMIFLTFFMALAEKNTEENVSQEI